MLKRYINFRKVSFEVVNKILVVVIGNKKHARNMNSVIY